MAFHPIKGIKRLKNYIRVNRGNYAVYTTLRILVILTAIHCWTQEEYESFFLCIFSLLLFLLPALLTEKFKIHIPPFFERMVYIFIFASEILGTVNCYYTRIPAWDTILHSINGFLCAILGFSTIYIIDRNSKTYRLEPLYLALVAFCFSMTIGVIWEFFEYGMDRYFLHDMQKDYIVQEFASVTLDKTGTQYAFPVQDITRTVIERADQPPIIVEGGYLDIGIIDTMKDLFCNFCGALLCSVIGYYYAKNEDYELATSEFLVQTLDADEISQLETEIEACEAEIEDMRLKRKFLKKQEKLEAKREKKRKKRAGEDDE